MTRFFIRPDQVAGETVTLDADDALHLDRVLRAQIGDEFAALDGSGKLYVARLTSLSKSRAQGEIVRVEEPVTEPRVWITVAQALPKTAEKLEWVLQHGVEVGASEFWVFRSRRSEAGKLAEKPERWAKIVKTAAEQSGRAKLPDVAALPGLPAVLARTGEFDLALLCDEAETSLTHHHALAEKNPSRVLLLIGPEGGWTDEERDACRAAGVRAVSLGPRILRTETAALVALSQVLYADGG